MQTEYTTERFGNNAGPLFLSPQRICGFAGDPEEWEASKLKEYLYPQNMKAESSMWLWTMRDFTVVAAAALISALVFAATKSPMPLAVTAAYGFLTIRYDEVCILDFLGWAIQYFITAQQKFRRELPGKKERKRKEKLPVKELLHIKGFTDHGIDSGEGELVFFSVKPSNISVLSPESIWEKVWRLQTVLASAGEMELLCLDSRESFADNQSHFYNLLRVEENQKVGRSQGCVGNKSGNACNGLNFLI